MKAYEKSLFELIHNFGQTVIRLRPCLTFLIYFFEVIGALSSKWHLFHHLFYEVCNKNRYMYVKILIMIRVGD